MNSRQSASSSSMSSASSWWLSISAVVSVLAVAWRPMGTPATASTRPRTSPGRAVRSLAPGPVSSREPSRRIEDVRRVLSVEHVLPGGELAGARHPGEAGDGRHPVDAQPERLAQGQHARDQVQPHGRRWPCRRPRERCSAGTRGASSRAGAAPCGRRDRAPRARRAAHRVEHQEDRPGLGHEVNGEHDVAEHRERAHPAVRRLHLDEGSVGQRAGGRRGGRSAPSCARRPGPARSAWGRTARVPTAASTVTSSTGIRSKGGERLSRSTRSASVAGSRSGMDLLRALLELLDGALGDGGRLLVGAARTRAEPLHDAGPALLAGEAGREEPDHLAALVEQRGDEALGGRRRPEHVGGEGRDQEPSASSSASTGSRHRARSSSTSTSRAASRRRRSSERMPR